MTSNKSEHYFHFSISPVQAFITSGRRTRDFWAGSFLLSFLCATAQRSVVIRCNQTQDHTNEENSAPFRAILPGENPEIRQAFRSGESDIQHACLPNRFSARVPENFTPTQAQRIVDDVRLCWDLMWQRVFKEDIQRFITPEKANVCEKVWERQLSNYWEIQWAITEDLKSGIEAMANRKHLRLHAPGHAKEPGVKCNYFAGLQEMSGITESESGSLSETVIKEFWTPLRKNWKGDKDMIPLIYDVDDQEMLSAVAFFKRRFAFYFSKFDSLENENTPEILQNHPAESEHIFAPLKKIWHALFKQLPKTEQFQIKGWELDSRIPSVTFLAAANWLLGICQYLGTEQDKKLLEAFNEFVKPVRQRKSIGGTRELRNTYLVDFRKQVKAFLAKNPYIHQASIEEIIDNLPFLEGNDCFDFLLQGEIAAIRRGYKHSSPAYSKDDLNKRIDKLSTLKKHLPESLQQPESYYAVIALDGDKFGRFLNDYADNPESAEKVGNTLLNYTQKAQQTVKKYNGFLIYAGGEDLVALLPGADAINCACQLQRDFTLAINTHINADENIKRPTISAAVLFSHVNVALMRVLRDVQQLLSGVAKQQYGRDAIAIRIVNQDGPQQQWGAKWSKFTDEHGYIHLYKVIEGLRKNDEATSNNFLYHLRRITQQLSMLDPERHTVSYQQRWQPQNIHIPGEATPDRLHSMILAQYLRTQNQPEETDISWFDTLFQLCTEQKESDYGDQMMTRYFNPDIAFIAKFLCSKVNCNIPPEKQEVQA